MGLRRAIAPALMAITVLLAGLPAPLRAAESCPIESFGEAVDESAAELRAFSAETQPKLKQKLQALRDHQGWTDPDFETKGLALVHDKRLDQFDAEAGELLGKIDTLGSPDATDPAAANCANLTELKAATSELMAVIRAKSVYLITRIDNEIGKSPAATPREVAKVEPETIRPVPAQPPASAETPAPPPQAKTEQQSPAAETAPPSSATPEPMPDLSPLRRADQPPKAEPKADQAPKADAAPKTETAKSPPPASEPATDPDDQPLPQFVPARPAPEAPPAVASEPLPPASPPATAAEGETKDETTSSWSTTTAQAIVPPPIRRPPSSGSDHQPPAYDPVDPGDPPGAPYAPPPDDAYSPPGDLPPGAMAEDEGYTIDEIREATRGFFGTISTSLASVIEYAFQQSGRPTAYVLGNEGGGAFLAGLRYGQGTLYLRHGGTQKVYWHGPSIGYDVGAEGSRTLFLIYNLDDPDAVFRRYTGVDGSAYLVGGVGMTLLKGGPVLMAPIRSGLGLRLGASIGYVRFTPRPTWNPF